MTERVWRIARHRGPLGGWMLQWGTPYEKTDLHGLTFRAFRIAYEEHHGTRKSAETAQKERRNQDE